MLTGLKEGQTGKYVFLPGSVERVSLIASHLDNARFVTRSGEFLTYTGALEGVPVSVVSTGIGGPSAAIAIEELVSLGAHTVVRIGSAASVSPDVHRGTVVIPSGAVRMEGTGDYYLPPEFPAVPDFTLFRVFRKAAEDLGIPYDTGITITKDSYYTEVSPETKPVAAHLLSKWEAYRKAGATNTSMECSVLFLAGAVLGVRTLSVMISATEYADYSNDNEDYPRDTEERAILVGIEGMRRLVLSEKEGL